MYTCRECEAEINSGTEICPQCGADLTIAPADDGSAKPPPNRQRIIIRWVVLLAILFGSLWSFLWFVVSPRTGQPTLQAETQALDSLTQIQSALSSYSAAMSGAYPSTLDPLGPPVRVAAQRAQSLGYQLQYVPGPLAADGSIHTYALQATAGNHGYRSRRGAGVAEQGCLLSSYTPKGCRGFESPPLRHSSTKGNRQHQN
jgi:hypothetical protein